MSRLVVAFIDDDQSKAVEKILRDAVDVQPMLGPIDDLDALADAVRDGTDIEHDVNTIMSLHSDGAALTIPADGGPLLLRAVEGLRGQLGDDAEIVRVTVIVEGRAKS